MDGEEQGEGQEGTNMYTHYNGTHNNVCTKLRTTVYGGGRGLRGPVGVGWCACDKTNTVNHVHAQNRRVSDWTQQSISAVQRSNSLNCFSEQ